MIGIIVAMSSSLNSERLVLTPLDILDVDAAIEMFTNPAVTKYVCDLMTEDEIRQEMSVWIKRGGDGCIGIWCISDRKSKEKYGSVFLLPMPIDDDDTNWIDVVPGVMPAGDVEIGYCLKERAWGRGYATEACKRLLRFAFEETPLQEVVASVDDQHEASMRVLTKSGLTYRGRRWAYAEDCPDWRISKSEWLASFGSPNP